MSRSLQILLVEDSQSDVFLTQEALKDCGHVGKLHMAADGVEAMAFLRREGGYASAPRPDLVLLDLNMPRKDGREVLAEIKGSAALRCIPVVVLTSSSAEADVSKAYSLYANSYVVKSVNFGVFRENLVLLVRYWCDIVAPCPQT